MFEMYRVYLQWHVEDFYIRMKWNNRPAVRQAAMIMYKISVTALLILIWLILKCIRIRQDRKKYAVSDSAADVLKKKD